MLPRHANASLQKRLGQSYVLGLPFAVLIAYLCSLMHFHIGNMPVSPLSAPGQLLTVLFVILVFLNFLLFEEIPLSHRRLPLNTSLSITDNTQLTPY